MLIGVRGAMPDLPPSVRCCRRLDRCAALACANRWPSRSSRRQQPPRSVGPLSRRTTVDRRQDDNQQLRTGRWAALPEARATPLRGMPASCVLELADRSAVSVRAVEATRIHHARPNVAALHDTLGWCLQQRPWSGNQARGVRRTRRRRRCAGGRCFFSRPRQGHPPLGLRRCGGRRCQGRDGSLRRCR